MRLACNPTHNAPKFTVDIEVANTHSYQLDNGVVVHNTVSQLVDSASGIHGRFAKQYIRTVRNDKKDPVSDFLISQGVPHETDLMKDSNWVFAFPMRAPGHARLASDIPAIEQLEHYKMYNDHWAEHSVSITIYVREHEWLDVAAWVYKNFDDLNGISFLPYSEHSYQQAPYQAISEAEYQAAVNSFPNVDFDKYVVNEYEDNTTASQNLACVSGVCEI